MKTIMVVPRWFPITEESVRALSQVAFSWEHFVNPVCFPATNNYFTSRTGVTFLKGVCREANVEIDKTNYYYVKMLTKWEAVDGYCQHQLRQGFTMTTNPMAHRIYPETSQANIDLLLGTGPDDEVKDVDLGMNPVLQASFDKFKATDYGQLFDEFDFF